MKSVYTVFKIDLAGMPLFPQHEAYVGLLASERGLRYLVLPQPAPQAVLDGLGRAVEGAARDDGAFGELQQQIRAYFRGELRAFNVTLDLEGATPFQGQAWEVIRAVPCGEARSYAWVARRMGRPGAARGVGQAMARNPVPLIIPCHRCIGSDGSLHGFGGGLDLKRWLLRLEGFTT